MKKGFLIWITLLHTLIASAQIELRSCTELFIAAYCDHSNSMSSARNDLCTWTQLFNFVPVDKGYVEVALYSFGEYVTTWSDPTADHQEISSATTQMCADTLESSTLAARGLRYLTGICEQRRKQHPYEYQMILIHSDYRIEDREAVYAQVSALVADNVIVVVSLPSAYERRYEVLANETRSDIDEDCYAELVARGAISVRSNLNEFIALPRQLVPKRSCN